MVITDTLVTFAGVNSSFLGMITSSPTDIYSANLKDNIINLILYIIFNS